MTQTKIGVGMINATSIGDAKLLQGDGSWVTPSGGLNFISNSDISSAATFEFTGFNASSFETYLLVMQNLIPATDNVYFWLRTSSDGGSSFDSSTDEYSWGGQGFNTAADEDPTAIYISLSGDTVATSCTIGSSGTESGVCGNIWIYGPHTTSFTRIASQLAVVAADGETSSNIMSGTRNSAADVDGIQLLFSSGAIESGTVTAYGYANS